MSDTNEAGGSRKATPALSPAPASSLPQKRALTEDDHAPPVSSPLNPNPSLESKPGRLSSHDEPTIPNRDKPSRTKKESLKKRESKVGGADSTRGTPDRKTAATTSKTSPPTEALPLRYKLAPPKPGDFEPARGPVLVHHHDVSAHDGRTIAFHESAEHVFNKKNFHYLHCIADPTFPSSFYYRHTEPAPYDAHMSFEDAATHMYFDQAGRHVTTDKGFRMARANVAVRQGRWYWECKITRGTIATADPNNSSSSNRESHGHVRMGFARREASLDAPVGFDAYSYGIRDVEGQKVHMSRPSDFFPTGEEIKEGDVIGLEICLPSEHLHRKVVYGEYNPIVDLHDEHDPHSTHRSRPEAANIVRDRIPIRFKAHIYFEKIDYHTSKELEDLMNPSPVGTSGGGGSAGKNARDEKPNPNHPVPALRTLPGSYIKVYKNGVCMGTAFEDLLAFLPPASKPQTQVGARDGMDDGMVGYYPAISVFRGGAAEVNFGPDFWFPPPFETGAVGEGKQVISSGGGDGGDRDVEMADAEATATAEPDKDVEGAANGHVVEKKHVPLRPVADRFTEQIVEDIVADVIDEVSFWMQDGAKIVDRTGGRDEKAETTGGIPPSREEIKELVQDD